MASLLLLVDGCSCSATLRRGSTAPVTAAKDAEAKSLADYGGPAARMAPALPGCTDGRGDLVLRVCTCRGPAPFSVAIEVLGCIPLHCVLAVLRGRPHSGCTHRARRLARTPSILRAAVASGAHRVAGRTVLRVARVRGLCGAWSTAPGVHFVRTAHDLCARLLPVGALGGPSLSSRSCEGNGCGESVCVGMRYPNLERGFSGSAHEPCTFRRPLRCFVLVELCCHRALGERRPARRGRSHVHALGRAAPFYAARDWRTHGGRVRSVRASWRTCTADRPVPSQRVPSFGGARAFSSSPLERSAANSSRLGPADPRWLVVNRQPSLRSRLKSPNFDRLARIYAPLERLSFGGALMRRRECFLEHPRLASARRALILGDGDGRFCAALLRRYPDLEVTAVDVSAAMLAALSHRVARGTPDAALSLECADARSWTPAPRSYDLLIAHFFFDCFSSNDAASLIARMDPAAAPDACWVISDFAVPDRGLASLFAPVLIRTLYYVFKVLTGLSVTRLPSYGGPLVRAGYSLRAVETALGGALRSELWERELGLTGSPEPPEGSLTTPHSKLTELQVTQQRGDRRTCQPERAPTTLRQRYR